MQFLGVLAQALCHLFELCWTLWLKAILVGLQIQDIKGFWDQMTIELESYTTRYLCSDNDKDVRNAGLKSLSNNYLINHL